MSRVRGRGWAEGPWPVDSPASHGVSEQRPRLATPTPTLSPRPHLHLPSAVRELGVTGSLALVPPAFGHCRERSHLAEELGPGRSLVGRGVRGGLVWEGGGGTAFSLIFLT